MDISLVLFAARGYDAVGIQEICEASGISKPTLYHYFQNKRGLLDSILDRDYAVFLTEIRKAADYQGDLPLTLERIPRVCFDFATRHPDFYRLILTLYFAPPDCESNQAVSHYNHELHQIIENVFVLAVVQHGNLRGRSRLYAGTYLGIVNNYIGFYLNGFVQLDDALLYQIVHQFMYGIYS
jgi:AcrR family transcriptional regulator